MHKSLRRQPNETIMPTRSVTGAAFWALMDRWGVADADALRTEFSPYKHEAPRDEAARRPSED